MPNDEKLRLNYYVGAMLAQGGEVRLEESKLVFSPTSALDRAMGAKDIEIPFQGIKGLEHKGDLSRTIHVKTEERIHKFEGSQVNKLADLLESTLKKKGFNLRFDRKQGALSEILRQQPTARPMCHDCGRMLKPGFAFCPYCGTSVKTVCSTCRHPIESDWSTCALCGKKLENKN